MPPQTKKTTPAATKTTVLDGILEKLQKSEAKQSSFFLTLEDGRLTIGWVEKDPDERETRTTRHLNIGERVSTYNILQSIESQL